MKYEALFEPIKIGNVVINNRIACTPMCVAFEDKDGFVTPQFKAFYAARAIGGTGLIETGTVTVTKIHTDRRTIGLKMLNTQAYPGLSELSETIHYFGSKVFMQIGTGQGRQVFSKKTWANPNLDVISASPVPYKIPRENYPVKPDKWYARRGLSWMREGGDEGLMPREATIEEIQETENTVAASVPILKALGYDGVEIHAAHGYFAFSFLSPRLNFRKDMYGGSLENQFRFIKNMIVKSRQAVGDDYVIGVRLSLDEWIPGGCTLEHTKYYAQEAEKCGADYILFSDGCHEAYKYYVPDENGTMLDRAGEVKKLVKIPIITPSVHDPDMAEKAIREGKTDMIGLARGLIVEPEWGNKVARGEPIRKCARCLSGCFVRLHLGVPIRCTENPEVGFEQYNPKYQMREPIGKERPCKAACPIGQNVPDYMELICDGKFDEALEVIREDNPLPGVLGRVCNHPCETECNRAKVDEAIAIKALKRFAADSAINNKAEDVQKLPITKPDKVAVVGSGPAGLAAAWSLAKLGYGVTIYEALSVAGGMLAYGIPEYRLPKKIVKGEIMRLEKMGIEIKLNCPVGDKISLNELQQNYKALFLAVGAQKSARLDIHGEELDGVYHGVDLLKKVNLGEKVKIGKSVAVIGGGNVAIDSARTALRLGVKDVTIVYRRSKEEMPAIKEEIEQAEQEGVKFHLLAAPIRICGQNGKVTGLECIKMRLGEPDSSGRKRPIPVAGSEFMIDIDTIVLAVGEIPDLGPLSLEENLELNAQGTLKVDSDNLATSVPGIFAGGDAVSGPATVVGAVAMGKRAAISIDCFLRCQPIPSDKEQLPVVTLWDLGLGEFSKLTKARIKIPSIMVKERLANFKEVDSCPSKEDAIKEADRCFKCSLRGWWGK